MARAGKSRKWRVLFSVGLIAVIAGILLGNIFYLIKIGSRFVALRKITSSPAARERLAVMPEQIDFADSPSTESVRVNLGYAEFSAPGKTLLEINSDRHGAIRGLTDAISFVFVPPFDPQVNIAEQFTMLAKSGYDMPPDHPLRRGDPLGWLEFMETAQIPSAWQTMTMRDGDFAPLLVMLSNKATSWGVHGIYLYETSDTKGIIHAGMRTDPKRTHISFADLLQKTAVGVHLRSTCDGIEAMELIPVIAQSFRFKINAVSSPDDILARIAEAGIPPRLDE